MVETAAYPRPAFSTFLRSDNNAGGDGLSWHDRQRQLRSKKISLLQDKHLQAHGAGHRKPDLRHRGWSRRLYKQPEATSLGSSVNTDKDIDRSGLEQRTHLHRNIIVAKCSTSSAPRVFIRERPVKSAHVRSVTWPSLPAQSARPKTAGYRNSGDRTASTLVSEAVQTDDSACEHPETNSGEQTTL